MIIDAVNLRYAHWYRSAPKSEQRTQTGLCSLPLQKLLGIAMLLLDEIVVVLRFVVVVLGLFIFFVTRDLDADVVLSGR